MLQIAPVGYLVITGTPEGYSRRQLKVLTAESIAKLLGPALRHSLGWLDRTQGVSKSTAVTTGNKWFD